MSKQDIINNIINLEGGYVNNQLDSGGETNYGITKQVASDNGYDGPMNELPRFIAFDIYSDLYWDSVKADAMPIALAAEMVDNAINMGSGRAAEFLQKALNALNDKQRLYADIAVDKSIGNQTLRAMNAYLKVREVDVLLKAINCLQGAFYIELSQKRQKDETFVYGWLKNRISL